MQTRALVENTFQQQKSFLLKFIFLNLDINRDYGFLCFSSAGWLSIIICYESASLESILFLLDEKSKSLVINCFRMNNFQPHAKK